MNEVVLYFLSAGSGLFVGASIGVLIMIIIWITSHLFTHPIFEFIGMVASDILNAVFIFCIILVVFVGVGFAFTLGTELFWMLVNTQ